MRGLVVGIKLRPPGIEAEKGSRLDGERPSKQGMIACRLNVHTLQRSEQTSGG